MFGLMDFVVGLMGGETSKDREARRAAFRAHRDWEASIAKMYALVPWTPSPVLRCMEPAVPCEYCGGRRGKRRTCPGCGAS